MNVVLLLVGALFALIGVLLLRHDHKLQKLCTAQTDGIVSDIQRRRRDDETRVCPVFDYTVNGVPYSKVSETGGSSTLFRMGQRVTVFYSPDDPNVHIVKQDRSNRMWGPLLLCVGILVGTIGFYLLFAA